MVKLQNVVSKKTRKQIEQGAYTRCFGDVDLGLLLSRVQSLIIQNGLELEKIVKEEANDKLIHDIDDFLSRQIMEKGVRLAVKKQIKESEKIEGHQIEPDFIVFQRIGSTQNCFIIELKDGHEFDTKSSAREHDNLITFLSKNADCFQFFNSYIKIVGFNAETKEEIHVGLKSKFAIEQVVTGKEFCELLQIDYERIVRQRALDRDANYNNFINEILNIDTVREEIIKRLAE